MQGRDSDSRWWTSPGRLVQRVLTLDDTPHSIALGTAIGMFVGLTPTVGIQMMVVLAVAGITQRLFHFNRLAGLITVYVSNPLTIVPLYAAFYYIGTLIVDAPMSPAEFQQRFEQTLNEGWFDPLQFIFAEVAWPMVAGSLLLATVCSLPTYPIVKRLVEVKRRGQVDPTPESNPVPPPELPPDKSP